ncbi:DUF4142 domain-containing protein [Mucilaginibacter litoreus]|uniref:DUF4142 domain-containing protein n=1 Tax=Mucilaginibacter litoreus TaxID=1048221 RepID=A0ABW3ANS5_9SPHI
MKSVFKLLLGTVIIAAASCSGNGNSGATDTDSTANIMSSSTQAAADSNEKELKAKDSTEVKADYEFAVEAANGGMMEVELGKLAQQKASSPQVVAFGKMMVTDHSKANTELKALAASKIITLPAILANKSQMEFDKMAKLDKTEFEKQYVEFMVKDHKEDIDKFKKEATDGKDAELKAFAAKTVPVLQHHLEEIQKIADAQKK